MKGLLIKTAVLAIVAPVLLYYNVAWAVLRCLHGENHSGYEATFYDAGSHAMETSLSSPVNRQADLDCTGPKYHTEWLAGTSAASELLRLTRDITPIEAAYLALSSVSRHQAENVRLNALFDRGSSPTFPIHLPLYLSLSVLRF